MWDGLYLKNLYDEIYIKDLVFFKKIMIRNDLPTSFYDDDGIMHCRLLDFLLNQVELF